MCLHNYKIFKVMAMFLIYDLFCADTSSEADISVDVDDPENEIIPGENLKWYLIKEKMCSRHNYKSLMRCQYF